MLKDMNYIIDYYKKSNEIFKTEINNWKFDGKFAFV